jgi:hypothetical protein
MHCSLNAWKLPFLARCGRGSEHISCTPFNSLNSSRWNLPVTVYRNVLLESEGMKKICYSITSRNTNRLLATKCLVVRLCDSLFKYMGA